MHQEDSISAYGSGYCYVLVMLAARMLQFF
jgi:hypothetical protein